jgi:predicted kinase
MSNEFGNLIIVRGLPGSGKSTFAKSNYVDNFGYILLEADMYFYRDGIYFYDKNKISNAHNWCYNETVKQLRTGNNVVVANTFTMLWEIKKYLELNPSKIYRCVGNYKNIHNVPEDIIQKMKDRFQDIEGEIIV